MGGIASRHRSALVVTAASAATGVVVFSIASAFVPAALSTSAVVWGGASGVAGMLAAACLYAALAIGPMTLVAPLTAIISGATPVLWALATGSAPDAVTWFGLILVLLGGAVISTGPVGASRGSRRTAIALAVLAGLLYGAFYILLAETPGDSGMIPLIANRAAGLLAIAAALLVLVLRGAAPSRSSASVVPVLATGLLDAAANALYVVAVRDGQLAVIAVIVSLYPAGTIALSIAVLRERIRIMQLIGVLVAAAGIVLLAL